MTRTPTMENARRTVLASASAEASRLGDRRIGTQHLLLALLQNPVSFTARTLGIDLAQARTTLDELDRAALAAIGLAVPALKGTPAMPRRRRPALTSGARSALHAAVQRALSEGARKVEERHLLYALVSLRPPDAVAAVLTALDIDADHVRKALERSAGDA